MRIFIPTMGRGPEKQVTVERLREAGVLSKYMTTLVCPLNETKQLSVLDDVAIIGCRAKGIAATRQYICDAADGVVLMLDDDLTSWSARREGTPVRYTRANAKELAKGLAEFAKLMTRHVHGGIGHRLFAQERSPIEKNTRLLRALAYNVTELRRRKVKFRIPVMEDFDVQLQLMKQGCVALQYNGLVQEQGNSGATGGCSAYRTLEVQKAAAERLAALHPDCVTVVTKQTKEAWKDFKGQDRTDVRINWRRAFIQS